MFRAMFSPIIRSTWLYLQHLVIITNVAAGWCHGWVPTHSGHQPAATLVNITRCCKYSRAPGDGRKHRPKHVELTRNNKLTYIVASRWLYLWLYHDARIHERQVCKGLKSRVCKRTLHLAAEVYLESSNTFMTDISISYQLDGKKQRPRVLHWQQCNLHTVPCTEWPKLEYNLHRSLSDTLDEITLRGVLQFFIAPYKWLMYSIFCDCEIQREFDV